MRNTKKPIQLYRGTTQQHSDYAGPVGEITVDTEKYTVVVQNGVTGGVPLAREDTVISLTNRIAAEESARATADNAFQKQIDDALPLSGGTLTGPVVAPSFQTGTAASHYFQCRKFRGEGNADTYYHAVEFGYAGHNQVDFYEYGGLWNFYKSADSGKAGSSELVGSIKKGLGWNGLVKGQDITTYAKKSDLSSAITDEASARETADNALQKKDTALQNSITTEASARKAADTALSNRLDVVEPVLVASDFTGDTNTVKKYVDAAMKNRASLASPAFSGTPTAPTADKGTNSTQIATTAFVQTAVSSVAVTRSETVLTTPITAGASVTVPAYTVGAMAINVYVNGIKCRRGDTFSEVGNAGEQSTSVTFNDAIPENYDVEVVIG